MDPGHGAAHGFTILEVDTLKGTPSDALELPQQCLLFRSQVTEVTGSAGRGRD